MRVITEDDHRARVAPLNRLIGEQEFELCELRAERDTLKARRGEQAELMDIWRTWLGASRESCETSGKVLWDRITAALNHAAPAAKDGA